MPEFYDAYKGLSNMAPIWIGGDKLKNHILKTKDDLWVGVCLDNNKNKCIKVIEKGK